MAVFVGLSTSTTSDTLGSFSPNDGILWSEYTCSESGTVSTLHTELSDASGNIQIAIYSADGASLLGNTGTIDTSGGAGEYSAALGTGVSVTQGTDYVLAVFSDADYIKARFGSGSDRAYMTGQTYASWPASLTRSGGSGTGTQGYTIWGEGSASLTKKLKLLAGYNGTPDSQIVMTYETGTPE